MSGRTTLAKRKTNINKTKRNRLTPSIPLSSYAKDIWNNYGHVLNPRTNKYVRLGSSESMRAIYELERNDEWTKRVEYIKNNHGMFGRKLEKYLQKKTHNI